jgi:branched-chain amino acid transport system ATP-binding protein
VGWRVLDDQPVSSVGVFAMLGHAANEERSAGCRVVQRPGGGLKMMRGGLMGRDEAVLEARGVAAGYHGHAIVRNLDLVVRRGEIVALLGPNGAGKTTTILTLAGDLPPLAGIVSIDGAPTKAPLHRRAREGLALITEERSIFPDLTTAENLRVGRCDADGALEVFPELRPLLSRPAGLLSGGEQQMLTLARALARNPRWLLADELSLGLAPMAVTRLHNAVRAAADERGIGVLVVEQHVRQALRVADRVYVLRRGEVVLEGAAAEMRGRIDALQESYLAADERA